MLTVKNVYEYYKHRYMGSVVNEPAVHNDAQGTSLKAFNKLFCTLREIQHIHTQRVQKEWACNYRHSAEHRSLEFVRRALRAQRFPGYYIGASPGRDVTLLFDYFAVSRAASTPGQVKWCPYAASPVWREITDISPIAEHLEKCSDLPSPFVDDARVPSLYPL